MPTFPYDCSKIQLTDTRQGLGDEGVNFVEHSHASVWVVVSAMRNLLDLLKEKRVENAQRDSKVRRTRY